MIRIKPFVASIVMLAAVAAPLAGQTKYGVTVTADKNVDYSTFRTYSWTPSQPSPSKTIDAQIVAAIDREMAALGMRKAATGPGDVLVTYSSLRRTDVDLNARPDDQGLRPAYAVGSLVVGLLEPGTRRRLLQLRMDKPIDTEPARLEAEINSAVAELFQSYPTRTKR